MRGSRGRVMDPWGTFLGTVKLPRDHRIAYVRDRRPWTVTWGEFREDYVVQHRIDLGADGAGEEP